MEKIFKFINLQQDKANHAFYLTFAYVLMATCDGIHFDGNTIKTGAYARNSYILKI